MNLDGTKSEENVKQAFLCEAQARSRYTYFALQARNEGKEDVAALFEEMAKNETEHAKVWFKILNNGLGESTENLLSSAENERVEWTDMYPNFAQTAREEGLELLAIMFDNIAAIEKNHENRFRERLDEIRTGKAATGNKNGYVCRFCGNVSDSPLAICPVCAEKDAYLKNEFNN